MDTATKVVIGGNGISPVLLAKADIQTTFRSIANNKIPGEDKPIIDGGTKNTADVAVRFMIAEQGRSYWNKQYETVKEEAKEAGILGTDADYIEGETVIVSKFPQFDITAKKSAGSDQVTVKALTNALNKHVTVAKRDAILKDCVTERKGAVTISVAVR